MHLKSITTKHIQGSALVIFSICAGLAACIAASFLRYSKSGALRDLVTQAIGHEARVLVEHFLSGYGVVLLSVVLLSIQYFTHMRDQPAIQQDGSAYRRFQQSVVRWSAWALDREVRFAIILAAVYLGCTDGWWEVTEAYFGASGKPPLGYIQWDQVAADFVGAALAVLQVWFVPTGVGMLAQRECSAGLSPTR